MPRFDQSTSRIVFDTAPLGAADSVEAYHGFLNYLTLNLDADRYGARIEVTQLPGLVVLNSDVDAQTLSRATRDLSRDGLDSLLVQLNLTGGEVGLAGDRSMRSEAGSLAILDLARPFVWSAPKGKVITLVLERGLAEDALGPVDGLHGAVIAPDQVGLFGDFLRAMAPRLGTLDTDSAPHLSRSVFDLLALCLKSAAPRDEARPSIAAARLIRAKRLIEQNLGARDLTPEVLARAVGISRSALYRQFEPLGGIEAHIQRRRLARVRRMIEGGDLRPLEAIAQDCGFADGAHMNRLYRGAFGVSPGRDRRGQVEPARGPANDPDLGGIFRDWVGALR